MKKFLFIFVSLIFKRLFVNSKPCRMILFIKKLKHEILRLPVGKSNEICKGYIRFILKGRVCFQCLWQADG